MPNQPKTDKTHMDKVIEGLDKVFRKGQNMPDMPPANGQNPNKPTNPKPDDKPKK